jgi:hypothetical protein
VYQGLAVISFAATQGETILYPDQIKVQLRMDTAQVVASKPGTTGRTTGPGGRWCRRLRKRRPGSG